MRPTDEIKESVKQMKFSANDETRKRMLEDVLGTFDEVNKKTDENQFTIWSVIMESKKIGMAVAAVIIVAVIVGLNQMGGSGEVQFVSVTGPQDYTLRDGSVVTLEDGAQIKVADSGTRGFEHVAGKVTVDVVKGKGEFIVKSAYGDVKALGTIFTVDMIDATDEESGEQLSVLAVDVEEGRVEVSNDLGKTIIGQGQRATMTADAPPYDFTQDEKLPKRLIERIDSMVKAMAAGDRQAYCKNYNISALYKLAKGQVMYEDHPDWYAGMSPEDAARFVQGAGGVANSEEELFKMFITSVRQGSQEYYVSSVNIDEQGKIAKVKAVAVIDEHRRTIISPKWTYFDGDWWQTDD